MKTSSAQMKFTFKVQLPTHMSLQFNFILFYILWYIMQAKVIVYHKTIILQ